MKALTIVAASAALLAAQPTLADSHMKHENPTKPSMHEGRKSGHKVEVEDAWARASLGANGAAYARLVNESGSPDRLVDVKADVAKRVEIHTHVMDGNIMRMRRVEGGIAVPPGDSITMKPGGYHVMMMGLNRKLSEGEKFPLTFVFEKGGAIEVTVSVMKAGAMGHGNMKPGDMKMDHGSGHSGR